MKVPVTGSEGIYTTSEKNGKWKYSTMYVGETNKEKVKEFTTPSGLGEDE